MAEITWVTLNTPDFLSLIIGASSIGFLIAAAAAIFERWSA